MRERGSYTAGRHFTPGLPLRTVFTLKEPAQQTAEL